MVKKRIISCVIFISVLLTLISTLTACDFTSEKIPVPNVEANVYIYDEDNIIDDDVEEKLNKMLVELEEKTEAEFAVISVESLLNKSIEDYSNNLFNTLGIGKKGEDNGLLLLFSRSDKRVRLEIGRGLEGCLNDAKCGRILDDYFVPYRETDEYTKATEFTVYAVLQVLCEEYDISISGLDKNVIQDKNEAEDSSDTEPGELIFIIIVILVGILLMACIAGGPGGSSSGSGFTRGFSGGSGGSFGGGFSGGGGASR